MVVAIYAVARFGNTWGQALAYAAGTPVGKFVWVIGVITALMTAFYSFRIVFLTFFGEFRGTEEQKQHLHESPAAMTIPLILLAIGAVGAGWFGIPKALGGHNSFGHFMEPLLGHPEVHASHTAEYGLMVLAVVIFAAGVGGAYYMYIKRTDLAGKLAEKYSLVYNLLWNKYLIDELYHAVIIKPSLWVANSVIVGVTDGKIIEGIVNGVPRSIGVTAQIMRKMQSGLTHRYASMMGFAFLLLTAIAFIWY